MKPISYTNAADEVKQAPLNKSEQVLVLEALHRLLAKKHEALAELQALKHLSRRPTRDWAPEDFSIPEIQSLIDRLATQFFGEENAPEQDVAPSLHLLTPLLLAQQVVSYLGAGPIPEYLDCDREVRDYALRIVDSQARDDHDAANFAQRVVEYFGGEYDGRTALEWKMLRSAQKIVQASQS